MNTEFTVSFKETPIIVTPMCVVIEVVAGDSPIGYIAVNRKFSDNSMTTTVTPFTADGEFEETHCPFCAAKKLFSEFTGFKLKNISVAETDDKRSSSFAGLIASILLSKA